jgi:hypothetical protein
MTHTITITEQRLSDSSSVYAVGIGNVWLPAVTQSDAISLADKLAAAIEDHTNEMVTRNY